jgi:hypothetical protein
MNALDYRRAKRLCRPVVVAYAGHCYRARVMDCVGQSDVPKRVRIENDIRLQGKVLVPEEYSLKCDAEDDD